MLHLKRALDVILSERAKYISLPKTDHSITSYLDMASAFYLTQNSWQMLPIGVGMHLFSWRAQSFIL